MEKNRIGSWWIELGGGEVNLIFLSFFNFDILCATVATEKLHQEIAI